MPDSSLQPLCELTSPSASPTLEDKTPSPDTLESPSASSISPSTESGPFPPGLPVPSDFQESEFLLPTVTDPSNLTHRPPEAHREDHRARCRWVLSENEGWLALRAKFRLGKLSPQEFRELVEKGQYFDVVEKPVPPPQTIIFNNVFPDAAPMKKVAIITSERQE